MSIPITHLKTHKQIRANNYKSLSPLKQKSHFSSISHQKWELHYYLHKHAVKRHWPCKREQYAYKTPYPTAWNNLIRQGLMKKFPQSLSKHRALLCLQGRKDNLVLGKAVKTQGWRGQHSELVSVQEGHYQVYTANQWYRDIPPPWMPSLITARTLLVTGNKCIRLLAYKLFTVSMCTYICEHPYTHIYTYTLLRMKEVDMVPSWHLALNKHQW